MNMLHGEDGPEPMRIMRDRDLEDAPEEWLENELRQLRRLLVDAAGRCRPHAVDPDGVAHFDQRRPWGERHWAIFTQRRRSRSGGRWTLERTVSSPDRPNVSGWQKATPIQRTIAAAEKGAQQRARKARKMLDRRNLIRQAIDDLMKLDHAERVRLHLRLLPLNLTAPETRNVMRGLLVQYQDGKCAICASRLWLPVLDHDHETDLVRGVLCSGCNSGEGGGLTWTPEREEQFAEYRANPPAAGLGWSYGGSSRW